MADTFESVIFRNAVTLEQHVRDVANGTRKYQNVYQNLAAMVRDGGGTVPTVVNGRKTYDFPIFRQGANPVEEMHDVINDFYAFIKEGAEGGEARNLIYILIGEPGNGKTFFARKVGSLYKEWLSKPGNGKRTIALNKLQDQKFQDLFGKIPYMQSQTWEDPMVLAMNLFDTDSENIAFLEKNGLRGEELERVWSERRELSADMQFNWRLMRSAYGTVDSELLKHVKVFDVDHMRDGMVVGLIGNKDKITASSKELIGSEDIQRVLYLGAQGLDNPYRFDISSGALGRTACGGISIPDEMLRNREDWVQLFLQVAQNRIIAQANFSWPIDTLLMATSNHAIHQKFATEENDAVTNRMHRAYVGHCTNRRAQRRLVSLAFGGGKKKTTFDSAGLHYDPNLFSTIADTLVLTRLPEKMENLTKEDMLRLAAGEPAGEHNFDALQQVVDKLKDNDDFRQRFGNTGMNERNDSDIAIYLRRLPKTNLEGCIFAGDVFAAAKEVIRDYPVISQNMRKQIIDKDLPLAKKLYLQKIRQDVFNAYRDDERAIEKKVYEFVQMTLAMARKLKDTELFPYWNPYKGTGAGETSELKMNYRFVNEILSKLGATSEDTKRSTIARFESLFAHRTAIGERAPTFMDNVNLVNAVTEYVVSHDQQGAGTLVGVLSDDTGEENRKVHDRIIGVMVQKLNHCPSCARRTILQYSEEQEAE